MTRISLVLAAVTAALAAATAAVAALSAPAAPTLQVTVGPAAKISLKLNGRTVSRLPAGAYRIVARDRSSAHNIALRRVGGTTTRTLTAVGLVGTRTVTVKLGAGRWEFFCAPHEPFMRAIVAVGKPTATTTTTTDDRGGHGEAEPGDDRGNDD